MVKDNIPCVSTANAKDVITKADDIRPINDQLIIGYDSGVKDDIPVLLTARKHNRGITIIKKIIGEDAKKLYAILTQPDQHVYNLAEYLAACEKKQQKTSFVLDELKRKEEILKENGIIKE